MALRTLTCLLRSVRTFPVVSDAFIFANYIHPELAKIANDQQVRLDGPLSNLPRTTDWSSHMCMDLKETQVPQNPPS